MADSFTRMTLDSLQISLCNLIIVMPNYLTILYVEDRMKHRRMVLTAICYLGVKHIDMFLRQSVQDRDVAITLAILLPSWAHKHLFHGLDPRGMTTARILHSSQNCMQFLESAYRLICQSCQNYCELGLVSL